MLSRLDPRLLIVLGAVLFSTGGAAIKGTAFTGWQVAGLRSGIAFLTLLVLVPAVRRGWSWRLLPVALAYSATLILFVLANKLTTAANTIFLQSTAPLYLLFLGPLVLHERLHRRDLFFMVALAAGVCLLFLSFDSPTATAPAPLAGNLLAAAAGVTWALTLLGLRWLAVSSGAGSAASAAALGNLVTFAICAWWVFPVATGATQDWWLVVYLGVVQIGVAYALVTAGMNRVSALEASLLILVEPVLNPFWAWVFLDEVPGALALAGGLIILISIATRTLRLAQRSKPELT